MEKPVRLTSLSHGAGCACKLSPADLADVMGRLPVHTLPPAVLVSADTRDDAAVYRLDGGQALVQTIDFFTPIVDDPFDWGRIAAANAFSDVYAMGATPVLALNVVAWPIDDLPAQMLADVLRGGQAVAEEAGVAIVGGHSIHDPEPKYGMAVTGFAATDRIVRNSTAPPGAALVLTKPLGVGIVTTAIKRGKATEGQVKQAVDLMTTLNRPAAEAMVEARAEAATDVTGFGFLGHLRSMAEASGVAADVDASAVLFLEGAGRLAAEGVVPGGTRKNHAFLRDWVDWGGLSDVDQLLLADAQTSGGLLIATTTPKRLLLALFSRGVEATQVGTTREGRPGHVRVLGKVDSG
jgi:selenide,water dikinase